MNSIGHNQVRVWGGKGAGLYTMLQLGLPVPHFFIIPTFACHNYLNKGASFFHEVVMPQVERGIQDIERRTGKGYGDPRAPLLVSVRSAALVSMPGMMDTVLSVGINDRVREGLAAITGCPAFAWDCHRLFLEMMGETVLKIEKQEFEQIRGRSQPGWDKIVSGYQELIAERVRGTGFDGILEDPYKQLFCCVKAVCQSWRNERALRYRRIYKIPEDLGTAVVIQAMAFGNRGQNSGAGVVFTRNPASGERELIGEFLPACQGAELVGGAAIAMKPGWCPVEELPEACKELRSACALLEGHFKQIQDVEFTIEEGRLYLLQTRDAKLTPLANLRFLADAVNEGLLSQREAVHRLQQLSEATLEHLLAGEVVEESPGIQVIAQGQGVAPKVATGKVVFWPKEAYDLASGGEDVILVRWTTSPNDILGIEKALGVVTSGGGITSHAAIICRELSKACVVGTAIDIDYEREQFITPAGARIGKGDLITIDGATGRVLKGRAVARRIGIDPKLREWVLACRKVDGDKT